MRNLEAVIFDMDGVLVDSEPWHYDIEYRLYRKLGLDVPDEVHLTYIGTANDHMYADLKKRYDIKMSLPELLDWDAAYRVKIFEEMEDIKPNPGLIDLLIKIENAGLKRAVATSSVPGIVKIILKKCRIDSFFETIVTTEQAGKSKPAPDVFLLAAKNMGVNPENCLVIEDSFNGVLAAKSAGMFCIAYQPHNDMLQDISRADRLIHHFNDITPEILHDYFR